MARRLPLNDESRVIRAVASTYGVRADRLNHGGGAHRMHQRSTLKAAAQTLLAFGIAGGFAALATGGCNMVSGLDSLTQAVSTDDGGLGDSGATGPDQVTGEGGVVSGPTTSTCTPDPAFCNTHCGSAKDNCGQARTCGDCGASSTCDPGTNTCQCAVATDFCSGRCGTATDNCTHQENCGGCEAGTCSAGGACGCDPDPVGTTCGAQKCGQTTNNCKQTVFCGTGGTANCATAGDFCEANGTCCTPNNTAACAGKCNQNVVNNCGQTIGCPASCSSGQVCDVSTCCAPDAVATTCAGACNGASRVNNCGQTVVCESCTGVCDTTTNTCCQSTGYCINGHECGNGQNNCHQTISCGNCVDQCTSGGTCSVTTGFCTCRCGGVITQSASGLHTQIAPCLPE
jgi:hypothetical protein